MASGSLTAAALRHRPRQAVLLVVLAAVVSASATLGPLYARAAEQSVLRTVLSEASVAERGVVVTSSSEQAAQPPAALAAPSAACGQPPTARPSAEQKPL